MEENMEISLERVKLSKISDKVLNHIPETLSVLGVAATMIGTMMCMKFEPKLYNIRYKRTGNEYYLIRYYQKTKSNNWLKMHGYPMRRKHR